jgi:hypothetical protein
MSNGDFVFPPSQNTQDFSKSDKKKDKDAKEDAKF